MSRFPVSALERPENITANNDVELAMAA